MSGKKNERARAQVKLFSVYVLIGFSTLSPLVYAGFEIRVGCRTLCFGLLSLFSNYEDLISMMSQDSLLSTTQEQRSGGCRSVFPCGCRRLVYTIQGWEGYLQ